MLQPRYLARTTWGKATCQPGLWVMRSATWRQVARAAAAVACRTRKLSCGLSPMRKARKAMLMEVVLEEPRKASMIMPLPREQRLGSTEDIGRFALFALEFLPGSAEHGTSPA